MPDFKMGNPAKTVISQSGTSEPSITSNVNIKDAFSALDSSATNGPTSGTAVTKSTTLPLFGCRAWVNFNGNSVSGTNCAIRASGNVSSVVRNDTGDYTINFETDMPDANYCVVGISTGPRTLATTGHISGQEPVAGSVRVTTRNESGTHENSTHTMIVVFR